MTLKVYLNYSRNSGTAICFISTSTKYCLPFYKKILLKPSNDFLLFSAMSHLQMAFV